MKQDRIQSMRLVAACAMAVACVAGAQDIERGKRVFEECATCHLAQPEKTDNVGPSLKGVFGRKAGSRDDFRYSGPMKRSGVEWGRATLDAFIADPQALVPGNRMPFSGLASESDRKALLDYLQQAMRE